MKRRAVFYIDGFNLYHGMCDAGMYKYIWLDLECLCNTLIKRKTENLVAVKYFTALVDKPKSRRKRHLRFINALKTKAPLISIYMGKFYDTTEWCKNCKSFFRLNVKKELTSISPAI